MNTIYKYELKAGKNEIDLPQNAKVLTVQTQNDTPFMWVLLNTSEPKVKRNFYTVGTGHDIDRAMLAYYDRNINSLDKYIGTFQLNDLGFVFHLFEIII